MNFSRQSILSIFVLGIGLAVASPHAFVSAQTTRSDQSTESDQKPRHRKPESDRTTGSNQSTESDQKPRHRQSESDRTTGSDQSTESDQNPESDRTTGSDQFKLRPYRAPSTYQTPNPSVESGTTSSNEKRIDEIRSKISQSQQVKNMCADVSGDIKFELEGDKLRIATGDHQCSYEIMQEVLQPQLTQGRIKTYEFSGDQEDVIVTL